MSSWRNTREWSQSKKLHTQSNMKTNTSFQLTQSIAVNEFPSPSRFTNSIQGKEEMQHSVIHIKQEQQRNNNSSFSLQPTITPQHIHQFMTMINMIRFYAPHQIEQLQLIRKKQSNISRLTDKLAQQQYSINRQKEYFQKQNKELQMRKSKVGNLKKKKSRAMTQQIQRIKYQIEDVYIALNSKGSQSNQQRSSLFIEAKTYKNTTQRPKKRKRIYLPYQSQHFIHPPGVIPMYPQTNPGYMQPYIHYQSPSPQNHYQVINSQRSSTKQLKHNELLNLSKLQQAFAVRVHGNIREASNEQSNLDYFDKSNQSNPQTISRKPSKNTINVINKQSNKQIRASNTSIKWGKDDNEDKKLVQIISESIKHLKTQKSQEQIQLQQTKRKAKNQSIQFIHLQQPQAERRNNRSSDIQINITQDSQQKRNNHNKSSDSNDSNYVKKKSVKNSEKSDRVKLEQSNIKIEGIDMSMSKNSGSSKSDSSKHPVNRHIPSLAQHFNRIEEQSEQVSLKTTPIEYKIKSSIENKGQNSKMAKKPNKQQAQILTSSQNNISSSRILKSPPNIYKKQAGDEQDEILRSIRLQTESKISRNKNYDSQLFMKKQQQYFDDILAGINLLRESKASRQKNNSSVNCLQQIYGDETEQKGSHSQIFNKEKGQFANFVDSSLRLSNSRKKNRNSYPDSKEFARKGFTQPIKRQLPSILSAQIEEEQDEQHSSKYNSKIGESYQ